MWIAENVRRVDLNFFRKIAVCLRRGTQQTTKTHDKQFDLPSGLRGTQQKMVVVCCVFLLVAHGKYGLCRVPNICCVFFGRHTATVCRDSEKFPTANFGAHGKHALFRSDSTLELSWTLFALSVPVAWEHDECLFPYTSSKLSTRLALSVVMNHCPNTPFTIQLNS